MNITPSLLEIEEVLAQNPYARIPLKLEILADTVTPISVLRKLQNISANCFMFESAEDNRQWGRYTFIGFEPSVELTASGGIVQLKSPISTQTFLDEPAKVIRDILAENKAPILNGFPPFAGGLVGYFSYDYIKYPEPSLKLDAKDEHHFKDMDFMLFEKIIAFDHLEQSVILIVNIKTDNLPQNYAKAKLSLKEMATIVLHGESAPNPPLKLCSEFRSLFSKESYCKMVEKAKEYIHEGDIFQVVLSNRLEADIEGSLLDTYRLLRRTNPSPYMFYFSSGDVEIVGASPETLVKLQDGKLHTFPLAGTRPRGATDEEDKALELELLADEKELAEHNMLVDLGRNDIGRISKIGSVKVEKYLSIEKFSHVMHIGSTVSGMLHEDKDALDAIGAILPAGTLSGAPKLRACEIINKLEDNKRGIYGGAIGYLDFSGNLDTCIAIRLAFSKNGKVFVRSGAGIVADSVPETEFEECINKAKAVTEALIKAQGGVDL